jgi:hypothetical protein
MLGPRPFQKRRIRLREIPPPGWGLSGTGPGVPPASPCPWLIYIRNRAAAQSTRRARVSARAPAERKPPFGRKAEKFAFRSRLLFQQRKKDRPHRPRGSGGRHGDRKTRGKRRTIFFKRSSHDRPPRPKIVLRAPPRLVRNRKAAPRRRPALKGRSLRASPPADRTPPRGHQMTVAASTSAEVPS